VEGGIFRSGCCGEGSEDVLDQQLEADNQRGFLVVLPFHVCSPICLVAVLQGDRDMESPSAPKRAAVDRGDNVRGSVRNGIRVDGERKHQ